MYEVSETRYNPYTALAIATFHDLTFALISQLGPIRNPIPH